MKNLLLLFISIFWAHAGISQNKMSDLSSRAEFISDSLAIRKYDSLKSETYKANEFDKALKYAKASLDLSEKLLGKSHYKYIDNLTFLGLVHDQNGQKDTALAFYSRCLLLANNHLSENHRIIGDITNNIAGIYSDIGKYNKALEYYKISLQNTAFNYGKEDPSYAIVLNNIAKLNSWLGKYETALSQAKEALRITKKTKGENHPAYRIRLNNLAQIYSSLGEDHKALPLTIEAIKLTSAEEDPYYGFFLHNIAEMYNGLGLYDEALKYALEAKAHTKEFWGEEHPEYYKRLHIVGKIYTSLGENLKAISSLEEAVELTAQKLGKEHPSYAIRLHNLGNAYIKAERYDKALAIFEEGLEVHEKAWGKEHGAYYGALNQLAIIYEIKGDYEKAQALTQEVVSLLEKDSSEYTERSGLTFQQASRIYRKSHKIDSAYYFLKKSYNSFNQELLQNFGLLSEEAQERHFASLEHIFDFQYTFAKEHNKKFPEIQAMSYNNALTLKGLRLASSRILKESILDQEDEKHRQIYYSWIQSKRILAKQFSLPIEKRFHKVDSLKEVIKKLEFDLALASQPFRDLQTRVEWREIQESLGHREAAIEFIRFKGWNSKSKEKDSTYYAAILLSRNIKYPQFISLFEEEQIRKLIPDKTLDSKQQIQKFYNSDLYKMIWSPFDSYLDEIDKIYYSPSGILYKLSFPALKLPSGDYLSEKYELHYMNSTRNILYKDRIGKAQKFRKAVIYGGIDYNNFSSERSDEEATTNLLDEDLFQTRNFVPNDNSRGRVWYYLPKSKEELEKLSILLRDNNLEIATFKNYEASEESFKDLGISGPSPDIIHLATHGFVFPDPKLEKGEKTEFLVGGKTNFQFSDNPLFRSGLIFTGANKAWKGGKVLHGKEDGILTAYEISTMDLSNTGLVVLSACQTGLGDVKDTEGVFGLQRAFKLAGAKNLMLTLWSIPDSDETIEFMETFYKNCFSGMSIRQAFNKTQHAMRRKFEDPYYWAGFVLID